MIDNRRLLSPGLLYDENRMDATDTEEYTSIISFNVL